jgi:hypothetical protein
MTRAEEIKILLGIYNRQVDYLAALEETSAPQTSLQKAEDRVSQFVNGGRCTDSTHMEARFLEKLV